MDPNGQYLPNLGHDFSQVDVLPVERTGPQFSQSCPLALPSPRACPFGGACHTCPATVQAKLSISQPGDKYEQEADRVADAVMSMPEPRSGQRLQRECSECDHEAQRQVELPKPEEEEEEASAKLLQRQDEPPKLEEEEEEELEGTASPKLLQRQDAEEKEEEEEKTASAKSQPGRTPQVTPAVTANINSLRSGGQPLPEPTRTFFEPRFGHDFSRVRVHADTRAAETAQAVHAKAFTVGRDVVFGAGQYAADTQGGRRLLAHELAHVLQQQAVQRQSSRLDPGRGTEPTTRHCLASPERISRWKISGNKATSDKDSDRLWNLAKQITGHRLDWSCIWPIKMQSPKAWEDDYERYIWIGDEFDISNLTLKTGPSKTFTYDLADDDLKTVRALYGGSEPVNLEQAIAELADGGKTPIQSLTVCGHTAGDDIWGDKSRFTTAGLKPEAPSPSGAGAHNKEGPRRCWFTRNATVRIVGCSSRTVAEPFAGIFLRNGAKALGTTRWVCWWHQKTPLDTRFGSVEGPPCNWPPTAKRLDTAAALNSAKGLWAAIRGEL